MSLLGALTMGGASLAAQQTGLQVTGNNITNAGTPGYTRQTVRLTPSEPTLSGDNLLGTGVSVGGVERQVSDALDNSLRNAGSDQAAADTTSQFMQRVENTFGALSDNDLSGRVSSFFNGFSTLANNPQDAGQRSVVIQNGVSLAGYVKNLRSQLVAVRDDAQAQIQQLAKQANSLIQNIAQLNTKISTAEAGASQAGTLRDQRDQQLTQLAQIIDVRTIQQPDGQFNVLTGSVPLIQGDHYRPIGTKDVPNAAGTMSDTQLVFTDNGDQLPATSGQIAALVDVRQNHIDAAVSTLDTFAQSLINTVNSIHSQGQGLSNFSNLTGDTQVLSPTAAPNAGSTVTGLSTAPVNGTFTLNVTDATTGQVTSQQVKVDFSGNGAATTLASLASSITGAGGGAIAATIDPTGRLNIQSNNSNITFSFSDDTSGVLGSLGMNTYFTGKDAATIGVNQTLITQPQFLATGRDNIVGSNKNAQALALGYTATVVSLGGQSLKNFYTNFVGDLASKTKGAQDDASAKDVIQSSLFAQREAYSGVSLDEEAINLTKYQRAFQGTARFISVVDDMMQTVLGLVK